MPEDDLAAQLERELDRYLGRPAGAIMLLGVFRFHNPGLDAFRPTFTLDVFSERRQREIADVLQRLAAFGPTKVAVETVPSNQRASTASTLRTFGTPCTRWSRSRTTSARQANRGREVGGLEVARDGAGGLGIAAIRGAGRRRNRPAEWPALVVWLATDSGQRD